MGVSSVVDVTGEDDCAFALRDTVRLLDRHGEIPAGTIGSVLGWFVNGGYVVNFPDEGDRVAEVHPDEIVLVEFN